MPHGIIHNFKIININDHQCGLLAHTTSLQKVLNQSMCCPLIVEFRQRVFLCLFQKLLGIPFSLSMSMITPTP